MESSIYKNVDTLVKDLAAIEDDEINEIQDELPTGWNYMKSIAFIITCAKNLGETKEVSYVAKRLAVLGGGVNAIIKIVQNGVQKNKIAVDKLGLIGLMIRDANAKVGSTYSLNEVSSDKVNAAFAQVKKEKEKLAASQDSDDKAASKSNILNFNALVIIGSMIVAKTWLANLSKVLAIADKTDQTKAMNDLNERLVTKLTCAQGITIDAVHGNYIQIPVLIEPWIYADYIKIPKDYKAEIYYISLMSTYLKNVDFVERAKKLARPPAVDLLARIWRRVTFYEKQDADMEKAVIAYKSADMESFVRNQVKYKKGTASLATDCLPQHVISFKSMLQKK